MPWECTVFFRQPGNTPVKQPSHCAKSYTARGRTPDESKRKANHLIPLGCQGKGMGTYGHCKPRYVK